MPTLASAPAVREVVATPAQLCWLAAHRPRDFPVFFDSAATGALGRYSLLCAFPDASLLLRGDGRLEAQGMRAQTKDFLTALDEWWRTLAAPASPVPDGLPFRGGWVVYLGYDLVGLLERGLRLPRLPDNALCAVALRIRAALIYDHARSRCVAIAEPEAQDQLPRLEAALAAACLAESTRDMPEPGRAVEEQDPSAFRDAVVRAQAYIGAGDIYQANLSRGWRVPGVSPGAVGAWYGRLRQVNPAPFGALANLPGLTLLSSSPERLVQVRDGRVETRPIAGTRARSWAGSGAVDSSAVDSDQSERAELLANFKERAEHVMLIDLERNDLGRICRTGSVEVNEFMVTESYPHVHHIVSNVRGVLRPEVTPGEVLRAVFPGGTITGCPKYRCMQIIGELEGEARGAYTGSLGYLNLDGSMDFNILIRTATLCGEELRFRAGAGIVADSDWQRELAETRAKARGLVRAFGAAA